MIVTTNYLPYERTGYFTKIVIDYLQQSPLLQPFYQHAPTIEGIKQSILARKSFDTQRELLVSELEKQYSNIETSEKVKKNISSLLSKDVFTVTTAHQPNIFTGPLYFIYKIMHAIKLADELKESLPEYSFVPVYYMGSEDADLDELGYVTIGGQKLVWNTKQTGAVGRMKVDKELISYIHTIYGQAGVLPFGKNLTDIFLQCYTVGKTIQQATLELTNALFASYGLVVLIPDNTALKKSFQSVVKKELTQNFSHKIVSDTILQLGQNYKVQAGGREVNLFYLVEDKRERIELTETGYSINHLGLHFSKEAILEELRMYPDRFSANVILRGAFQETILPNIAFIGGGGELAYWLELKNVFDAVQIPYPVLLLRNSFLIVLEKQEQRLKELGFSHAEYFNDSLSLVNQLVKRESEHHLSLSEEIQKAKNFYQSLRNITDAVDITLSEHVAALEQKSIKKIIALEKKLISAERKKFQVQQNQIHKLRSDLFPGESLQERTENFSLFYAALGPEWLQILYRSSKGLEGAFGLITY